jgi:hypothetical protein
MQAELRDLIRAAWPRGIQAEQVYAEAYEYKLKGTPFDATTEKENVGSCRMIRDILAFLYARGWRLDVAIAHAVGYTAKDTLIFRREDGRGAGELPEGAVTEPPPVDWLALSMSRRDRLRIICDGPHDVAHASYSNNQKSGSSSRRRSSSRGTDDGIDGAGEASRRPGNPAELGRLVTTAKDVLARRGFLQDGKWSHDSYEFKLKGHPWSAWGKDTMRVRLALLQLVAALDRLGWRSYAAVHHRCLGNDYSKPDTWYLVRPRDWVPGSPFNAAVPLSPLDM